MTRHVQLVVLLLLFSAPVWADDLRGAARLGDLERVRRALDAGDDPSGEPRSPTPLMEAAMGGHVPVLELLVSRGADLERADQNGDRAIHWAISHQRLESVEFLLSRGADVNARGHGDMTPLLRAAASQSTPILKRVLSGGGRLNARNQSGWGPVFIATIWSSAANLEVLLAAGGDPDETGNAGEPALVAAGARGDTTKCGLLLKYGADPSHGAAAWRGAARLARDMSLTRGPTAAEARGAMALLLPFVTGGGAELVLAASAGEPQAVVRLLELGAPVDAVADGLTPLGAAATFGHVDIVVQLLAKGASRELDGTPAALDIAATDDIAARLLAALPALPQPSLDRALRSAVERGQIAITRRLLAAGADPTTKDERGLAPLELLDRAIAAQHAIVKSAENHRGIPGWAMDARDRAAELTAARPVLVALLGGRK